MGFFRVPAGGNRAPRSPRRHTPVRGVAILPGSPPRRLGRTASGPRACAEVCRARGAQRVPRTAQNREGEELGGISRRAGRRARFNHAFCNWYKVPVSRVTQPSDLPYVTERTRARPRSLGTQQAGRLLQAGRWGRLDHANPGASSPRTSGALRAEASAVLNLVGLLRGPSAGA